MKPTPKLSPLLVHKRIENRTGFELRCGRILTLHRWTDDWAETTCTQCSGRQVIRP